MYSVSEITEKLLPVFDNTPVEKAILFGSYAKGYPEPHSDIDIVIDSKGMITGIDFFGVLEDITEALNMPVDLIEASQIVGGSRVHREILETGIAVYDRAR
ncbi:MAG: nucleotidyltransferase domain-containing protein [Treponema sp.]|nr:nucleotidyltransferase domain-containing protein [Treponema sp.]